MERAPAPGNSVSCSPAGPSMREFKESQGVRVGGTTSTVPAWVSWRVVAAALAGPPRAELVAGSALAWGTRSTLAGHT